jgi:predicted metal-dependent hydrolase
MQKTKNIIIDGLEIQINYKKIKNLNLKVKHNSTVELSVPSRITDKDIENFVLSKLEWIKKAKAKFSKINPKDFLYLGKKYEIKKIHHDLREIKFEIFEDYFMIHSHLGIPDSTVNRRLEKHFEEKLVEITREFFEKWEKSLNVSKNSLSIKKLRGKWGFCHTRNHDICLNVELIKKDIKFIEYVVLHELCHILVPDHGPNFKNLLNTHMPDWKKIVKEYSY